MMEKIHIYHHCFNIKTCQLQMLWGPQHKGRRTKSIVSITDDLLKPRVIDPKIVQQELTQNKLKQKYYYKRLTKSPSKLQVGENILIQMNGKWRPAKVIYVQNDTPHSYDVTTPEGQTYWRNRCHLKRYAIRVMKKRT